MSYNKVNQTTGDLEQIAGSQVNIVYADAPLGAIIPYGGTTIPEGWFECDGSAVSRATYADLFVVIGTKFGPGDGSTTFNLPSGDFGAQLYPAFEGMYIIKAIKTVLPTDFQEALAEKQNITDNTLQTTSKTVPGAINEINSEILRTSTKVLPTYKGLTFIATKTGNMVSILLGGTANEDIPANQVLLNLTGPLQTIAPADIFVTMASVPGQRLILGSSTIYMVGAIPSGTALRGSVIYPATNFDILT